MALAAQTPKFPASPPAEALKALRSKGFKIGFSYQDVWQEEHQVAFTVAKAMRQDLLEVVRAAVDQALEQGLTFQTFQQQLMPLLDKLGWTGIKNMIDPTTGEEKLVELGTPRRLRVIYDTNMRVQRAVGQWERIQRTAEERPYLLYQLGPSERHRPQHEAWSGTLLPIDDPFWDVAFPPNGWGCKCRVVQLGIEQTQRRGGVTASPKLHLIEYENKRTGEILTTPRGIDPGWAYNPGKKAA
jgi:uncharacterized protein with gpF-like domain